MWGYSGGKGMGLLMGIIATADGGTWGWGWRGGISVGKRGQVMAKRVVGDTGVSKRVRKYVYFFFGGRADGNESMKALLGGKGANLAEMAGHPSLRLSVPPGFTITTEVCTFYHARGGRYPRGLAGQLGRSLAEVERLMGRRFGDVADPLLLSVRSGARRSMPGMMETVLNLGLGAGTLPGLVRQTGDERFVYDAYRRLIMMYADVVMEKGAGVEPRGGRGIRKVLDERLEALKRREGYDSDTQLSVDQLKGLVDDFRTMVLKQLGRPFPEDPWEQLWGGIGAVFSSWNGRRAVEYRRIEKIPDDWGTAVNVQAMVFGNMGNDSATGVAFTRNPGTGENRFYGEYLLNAQGEDVVAGIRTPVPVNAYSRNAQSRHLPTMERTMPDIYRALSGYQARLERHYRDMQDIEFTIQQGVLYMLQCRVGKRNGVAAVKMAVDMHREGLISGETAVGRVSPNQLVELLLPRIHPDAERVTRPVAKGLPAGPGGARGRVVFRSADAVAWASRGEPVVLVREETSPEDVDGMHKSQAILTTKGGMTSHAALVARGWGKCCIVGCGDIEIDPEASCIRTKGGQVVHEGDWLSLNGSKGWVYEGQLPLVEVDVNRNRSYRAFLKLVDRYRTMGVRANADTARDAATALAFGAEGIGLFRTEHMFYGEGSENPLSLLRRVILSRTAEERRSALDELSAYMKRDIRDTLSVMAGHPVTIRLLDPPLHEFVPHDRAMLQVLGRELGISLGVLRRRVLALHENNPMLGHRGVRLGISHPEITEMQVRAILEASAELAAEGCRVMPEIMVPVTCTSAELVHQRAIVERVHREVCTSRRLRRIPYHFGTMIETPRAALQAGEMAREADFFSFGTNDLTQMSFGFSRDDIGGFLPSYLEQRILREDPFHHIDMVGVGELVKMAAERGRGE